MAHIDYFLFPISPFSYLAGDELDRAAARHKAQQIVEQITRNPVKLNGVAIDLGASAGAVGLTGSEDPEEALKQADLAMYEIKKSG